VILFPAFCNCDCFANFCPLWANTPPLSLCLPLPLFSEQLSHIPPRISPSVRLNLNNIRPVMALRFGISHAFITCVLFPAYCPKRCGLPLPLTNSVPSPLFLSQRHPFSLSFLFPLTENFLWVDWVFLAKCLLFWLAVLVPRGRHRTPCFLDGRQSPLGFFKARFETAPPFVK